jgi:hypothetical protein
VVFESEETELRGYLNSKRQVRSRKREREMWERRKVSGVEEDIKRCINAPLWSNLAASASHSALRQ